MNEKNDYYKSLNVFAEMYKEQQNKILNILNDITNSLSGNSLKIPDVNILQLVIPQIDIKPLEEKNTFDSVNSATQKLANMSNVLTESLRKFLDKVGIGIRELLIFDISVLGELEWCYLEIEELEDSDLLDLTPSYFREYLDDNEHASIKDIDEHVTKFFTKKIIDNITDRTILNLDINDKQKLEQAMIDFRARRYLDCANLLASLMDSQSIKQELYDLKNGRYGGNPINVSQGWQAFFIVFRNDLSKYFDGKSFNGSGKKATRENGFKEFIGEVKSDLSDYETKIPILLLASCLINFFDDSNWKNYPQKPEVINRHWLMHGMYDIDDITKSDCIKLLLMLNQLTNIYAKLRNGEL